MGTGPSAGRIRWAISIGVVAATALVFAPGASASVTIGSDLAPDPSGSACGSACTVANLGFPSGPASAPSDGVITSWAIRYIGNSNGVRLRVLRPQGMGVFQAINSSTSQNLP